ncbi:MAG: DUF998 domain-containing protein, partial [Candidatus Caldarchaeales archaeon]
MSRDGLIAGLSIVVGVTQFMIFMIISEALYPNYSVAYNYISDLGVGITASIFNTSIIFLGFTVIFASYFLNRLVRDRLFSITIFLTGIGA